MVKTFLNNIINHVLNLIFVPWKKLGGGEGVDVCQVFLQPLLFFRITANVKFKILGCTCINPSNILSHFPYLLTSADFAEKPWVAARNRRAVSRSSRPRGRRCSSRNYEEKKKRWSCRTNSSWTSLKIPRDLPFPNTRVQRGFIFFAF